MEAAKEDTNKVKLLDHISYEYRSIDPDEGIRYGELALALARQLQWAEGIGFANSSLAANYQYRSDYPKAYEYNMAALKKFEETGDKRMIGHVYSALATIYQYEKTYPKVLEYDLKALKIFEELNDSLGIRSNLVNLGIFYFSQKDYDKALEYDFKALDFARQIGQKSEVARNLGNIGDVYLHKNNFAQALFYDLQSLQLFEELGDKYSIAIDLGNIGETYVTIAKDTPVMVIAGLVPAGKQAKLDRAINYLNRAINESREIAQLENIIEFSQYLSDAYLLSGNCIDALTSYKLYATMYDSVYSLNNASQIKQSEHLHDLELKDRDIKLAKLAIAKKQNEQIFFIVGILVLLLIIGIVFVNYNSQKNTNKLLSKEKNRSDDLLLNILPAEVAAELKEKGSSTAKYFDNVTVMFTDFVDFTGASMRKSPQQLISELHTCFKAFDEIMRKYHIEKIKTVGDAYLAVSGLPVPDPNHAENIIMAATEIMHFMKERKQQMGDDTFDIRIGIHSGGVIAGIVGVIKFAYDIWGDTVNTAARMEEHGKAGKINISQTTFELVKDKFQCTYRGEIEAKNKGMMKMYFVETI